MTLEKERIVRELQDVREEWVIEAIQRLLSIFNEEAALIERYRQHFPPISTQEVIEQIMRAQIQIAEGRGIEAADLLQKTAG